MEKLLLSRVEVQQVTGMGETFIKNETRRGRLRSVKVGDRRMYPANAVREYVESLEAEQREPVPA